MLYLTVFTSDMRLTDDLEQIATGTWDVNENDPDAYSVPTIYFDGFDINVHVDDLAKGRALAAAIIAACDRTEAARAKWAAEHTDPEAHANEQVREHNESLNAQEAERENSELERERVGADDETLF